jgi:hypothetical protein
MGASISVWQNLRQKLRIGASTPYNWTLPAADGAGTINSDGSGTLSIVSVVPATSPGGSTTQVQFNNSGAFGGDAGLTYNSSTDALTVASKTIIGSIAVSDEWTGSLVGAQLGGLGTLLSHDTASAGNSMEVCYNSVSGAGNNPEYMISSEEASKIVLSSGINFQVAGTGTKGTTISYTDAMTITSSGNIDLGGTLDVTGATTLDSTLGVGSTSTASALTVATAVPAGSGAMSGVHFASTVTGTAGNDIHGVKIASTLTEAGSGVHANLNGLLVAPTVDDHAGATATNVSGIHVSAFSCTGTTNAAGIKVFPPTGATNNYAIWSTGNTKLDGTLTTGSGPVALTTATGKLTALSATEVDNLSGAALTTLNGSNISSGTVASARLELSGQAAANISSGQLANARLPTDVDLGGTLDVTSTTTLDTICYLGGGVQLKAGAITLAADATTTVANVARDGVLLLFDNTTSHRMMEFLLQYNTGVVLNTGYPNSPARFSNTADTGTSINVYYDSSAVTIQNKHTGSINLVYYAVYSNTATS